MSEAPTLTLTDFLLARFREDEVVARGAILWDHESWTNEPVNTVSLGATRVQIASAPDFIGEHVARHDPARVLAECEAKRRLVTVAGHILESWEATHGGQGRVLWEDVNRRERHHANETLAALALPYAAHPDYRDEWMP